MKKRWIQSLGIILIFAAAMTAVIFLGIDRGRKQRSVSEAGLPLTEKSDWEEAITSKDEDTETQILVGDSAIVYKTENGKKFHLYSDCSSLRNSKSIIGITGASARAEEKTICSVCEKRAKKTMANP